VAESESPARASPGPPAGPGRRLRRSRSVDAHWQAEHANAGPVPAGTGSARAAQPPSSLPGASPARLGRQLQVQLYRVRGCSAKTRRGHESRPLATASVSDSQAGGLAVPFNLQTGHAAALAGAPSRQPAASPLTAECDPQARSVHDLARAQHLARHCATTHTIEQARSLHVAGRQLVLS
jgi:hypothetical protein